MNAIQLHAVLMVAVLVTGCAGVSHTAIPQDALPFNTTGINEAMAAPVRSANAKREKDFKGIRYYGTSLYLLVYSDGKGNVMWKILELPDQTKLMAAHPYNVLARQCPCPTRDSINLFEWCAQPLEPPGTTDKEGLARREFRP